MPNHKSGTLKQKNKPFKGGNKNKHDNKVLGITSNKKIQKIDKPLAKMKKIERINRIKQIRMVKEKNLEKGPEINSDNMLHDAFAEIVEKSPGAPKVILLAAFNQSADTTLIKESLLQLITSGNEDMEVINGKTSTKENNVAHEFQHIRLATNPKISSELRNENYIVVNCPRNPDTFLDYCKVADIVVMCLSCKDADQSNILLDPFQNAKAFDELGYQMLKYMRYQGQPSIVGVLQDLDSIQPNKQASIKKIFHRFFESEIGDEKFVTLSNNDPRTYFNLLRTLQELHVKELEWREIRSYFLAEKLQVNQQTGTLEIEGFIKGNFYNPNQLVHVTGFGDYAVSKLEIIHNPFIPNHKKEKMAETLKSLGVETSGEVLMSFMSDESRESMDMFPAQGTQGLKNVVEKIENNIEETKENTIQAFKEEEKNDGQIEAEGKIWDEGEEDAQIHDDQSDVSFNELNNTNNMIGLEEEKKRMRELVKRDDDEKEFEDEVDYPTNVMCQDRFRKYKGLKRFRTGDWNAYNDIPQCYENILIFSDFNKSRKVAFEKAQNDSVAFKGFYVKLYLENFPVNDLVNVDPTKPIIVSSLLKYERNVSVLNMKVRRLFESSEIVKSKEKMEIHLGFRIMNTEPIFSKIFAGCNKTKYDKRTFRDQVYLASIYGEVTFPPANALFFRTLESGERELCASGELLKPDPMRIILKRIILCGYPLKINKKKAVVRMMFFNSIDVKYFSPIELYTKNGLRGHIQESLGTHGYMKCIFNSRIKANDTVCLYLYKRVFPKWPFGPSQSTVENSGILSLQNH